MPERYEFSLPDGRAFGSDKTPEEIRQLYPEARITAVVTLDDNGEFVSREAYKGKAAEPPKPEQKTVAQLREELEARGVEIPSDAKKADLIALLEGNDGAGDGTEGQGA